MDQTLPATAIRRFRNRLAKESRALRGANVAAVLAKIVPVTRGWVAYYRTVVSSRVFGALDDYLWKLTCKWACRSHSTAACRAFAQVAHVFGTLRWFLAVGLVGTLRPSGSMHRWFPAMVPGSPIRVSKKAI